MFDYAHDPSSAQRRRQYRSSFNTSYTTYEDAASPHSLDDMRQMQFAPPSPLGWRTYSTRTTYAGPRLPLADLPSRVNALTRRGDTLSTYLAHLAAVMQPLRCAKVAKMSELDVKDILHEGMGVHDAMQEFAEQFEEVSDLLRELSVKRRDVVRKVRGEEKSLGWKGGEGKY